MCSFVCAIDHGVNEGEHVNELYREQVCKDQYREPETEGRYLDQDFPEDFVNGKFNLILWLHILTQFYKHNLSACFTKLHIIYRWNPLDGHPLIDMIIPSWPRLISKYDSFYLDINHC